MNNLRRLDINLLLTLDVLLAEHNVTRAAERLSLSQPSVSERIVNLSGTSSFTSQTTDTTNAPGSDGPGKPNVYHISPNIGGLFVADEEHTVTHLNTDVGPITITVDSVSTMHDIEPVKLK